MKPWISMHIYYNKDPRQLLTECVTPLIEQLRSEGLLERYFFIRYFEGGSHVRLRLLPARPEADAHVKAAAEAAVTRFLERRPSLMDFPSKHMPSVFSKWFEFEYGADKLHETYGPEGLIPYYPNNSFHYIPYRPELARYGGEVGVDLAERHFEASSDVALGCLRETNVHVRTILLGQAIQLMQLSLLVLVADEGAMRGFLKRYEEHWSASYDVSGLRAQPDLGPKYERVAAKLGERYRDARRTLEEDRAFTTSFATKWKEEVTGLKARLEAAWQSGHLRLPEGIDSFPAAVAHLLTSYMHMTNNRLGLQLVEEAYLAHLLGRAIEDVRAAS